MNKGLTKGKSENSEPVDIKDIAQLRRWLKDDADTLKSQLIDFLCRCKSKYPLWRPDDANCCSSIINEGTNEKMFNSGFYFRKRNRGCGCK